MKMTKKLEAEIIEAAESLTINDLFDACGWLRSTGVELLDKESGEVFAVIPQMEEICADEEFARDLEICETDSLEKLLHGIMECIRDDCRKERSEGSTVDMFFRNYKFWKECFCKDEKAGKDHPGFDQVKAFAFHETLADWLREVRMQDMYDEERAKVRRSELKCIN